MAKRIPWKTIELSKLTHLPDGDGIWQDMKWECYLLGRNETKSTVTESKVRVNYTRHKATKVWHEVAPRHRYYTRHKEYLCLEGNWHGQYHTATEDRDNYKLFTTQDYWDGGDNPFPRKVLLATETLAKKLGLKW